MNIGDVKDRGRVSIATAGVGITLTGPIKSASQVFVSYDDEVRGQVTKVVKLAFAERNKGTADLVFASKDGVVYLVWYDKRQT